MGRERAQAVRRGELRGGDQVALCLRLVRFHQHDEPAAADGLQCRACVGLVIGTRVLLPRADYMARLGDTSGRPAWVVCTPDVQVGGAAAADVPRARLARRDHAPNAVGAEFTHAGRRKAPRMSAMHVASRISPRVPAETDVGIAMTPTYVTSVQTGTERLETSRSQAMPPMTRVGRSTCRWPGRARSARRARPGSTAGQRPIQTATTPRAIAIRTCAGLTDPGVSMLWTPSARRAEAASFAWS